MAVSFRNILNHQSGLLGVLGGLIPGFNNNPQVAALKSEIQGEIAALESLPQTADIEARVAALEAQMATINVS